VALRRTPGLALVIEDGLRPRDNSRNVGVNTGLTWRPLRAFVTTLFAQCVLLALAILPFFLTLSLLLGWIARHSGVNSRLA
jgi:hypothetical protein